MTASKQIDYNNIVKFLTNSSDINLWRSNISRFNVLTAQLNDLHTELSNENLSREKLVPLFLDRKRILSEQRQLWEANTKLLKPKYHNMRQREHHTKFVNIDTQNWNYYVKQNAELSEIQSWGTKLLSEHSLLDFLKLLDQLKQVAKDHKANTEMIQENLGGIENETDTLQLTETGKELDSKKVEITKTLTELLKHEHREKWYHILTENLLMHSTSQADILSATLRRKNNSSSLPNPKVTEELDNEDLISQISQAEKCNSEQKEHANGTDAKSLKSSSHASTTRRALELELERFKLEEEAKTEIAQKERELELKRGQMELEKLKSERSKELAIKQKQIEIARATSSKGSAASRSMSPASVDRSKHESVKDWLNQSDSLKHNHAIQSNVTKQSGFDEAHFQTPQYFNRTSPTKTQAQFQHMPIQTNFDIRPTHGESLHLNSHARRNVNFQDNLNRQGTSTPIQNTTRHENCDVNQPGSCLLNPLFPSASHTLHAGDEELPSSEPTSHANRKSQVINNYYYDHNQTNVKLPHLKLTTFSGDPLEWPEWSALFTATVDQAKIHDSLKMNHLKTLVTGKAKNAISGMGYTAEMYHAAWHTLEQKFGRPRLVVNAQLKRMQTFPPLKPYDNGALINFSQVVSNCVNVLNQMQFLSDLQSESVLGSAARKLPINLQSKWWSFVEDHPDLHANLILFNSWLSKIAYVQESLTSKNDSKNGNMAKERVKPTSLATVVSASKYPSKLDPKCPMGDGIHKLHTCPAFKAAKPSERYEIVKKSKLCFLCFNSAHGVKDCKFRPCNIDNCGGKHNHLLHIKKQQTIPTGTIDGKEANKQTETTSTSATMKCGGFLPIVELTMETNHFRITTFALCDSGSTVSYIDETIAKQLPQTGEKVTLSVNGINKEETFESILHTIEVLTDNGTNEPLQVYTHPCIHLGDLVYDYDKLKAKYDHLQPLPNGKIKLSQVKVILGQDYKSLHHPIQSSMGQKGDPFTYKTQFGWVLSGPLNKSGKQLFASTNYSTAYDPLAYQVKRWWDIEAYASKCNVDSRSKEDIQALALLTRTTRHNGERYEVGLLWANEKPQLPNNYDNALSQLKSLEKRLNSNLPLKTKYQQTITADLERGFIRSIDTNELKSSETDIQWYLPHHPVVNPHKPEKVRRVCNAASTYKGSSLNDQLLTGPDLLQNLIGIIFRFREHAYAITADIESMFLQVAVPSQDCKCLRFLWRENSDEPVQVYQYTRHIFGAKSSPTCANYALQQTVIDFTTSEHIAKTVVRNFYMDDLVKSVETIEEATEVYQELKPLLQKGGFELKKWIANSPDIMEHIPIDDRSNSLMKSFEIEPQNSSILGLHWDVHKDTLSVCRGSDRTVSDKVTQRVVLSYVSSVFDPLGILAPFTMRMRILLKAIWISNGQSWDQEINQEQKKLFTDWVNELPLLKTLVLQRQYVSASTPTELHVFADASEEAMSMVAYFRHEQADKISTPFVMGKCRIAPMRHLSIPRLELQAATYAVRLKNLIQKEHDIVIKNCHFWSDSTTVLQWLHNSHKKQNVFVANRVAEILESSTLTTWSHVKSELNPADMGTRGMTMQTLQNSDWLTGPAWLGTPKAQWNVSNFNPQANEELSLPAAAAKSLKSFFPFARFSRMQRAINTQAYINRCFSKAKPQSLKLDLHEVEFAEIILTREAQRDSFPELYQCLHENKDIPKSLNMSKLSPFLDENGIVRIQGRLHHSQLDYNTKHPILLTAKHKFTELLLLKLHLDNFHQGTEYIRSVAQQHYWIIGIRNLLRSIKNKCIICRKQTAQAYKPYMANLPPERLAERTFPFAHTGVDYFGPFEVRYLRRPLKRWCCLFTCLTTRAVHIEIVPSLDTESCMQAITRFIARRGKPLSFLSDNGTNFVGSANLFKTYLQQWKDKDLEQQLANNQILWKFNPPAAPHFGGIWERMVQACKKAMFFILGNRVLTDEVLSTTMCLVEQSLNARPLTPCSDDPNDLEALTPNHFLIGRPSVSIPYLPDASVYIDSRKAFKKCQAYMDMIWTRWSREYLPKWNQRPKWNDCASRALCTDELVWVIDDTVKRGQYRLGRVTEVFYGPDGVIRSARVKTANGELTRPAVKLAPLFYEYFAKQNRAGDVGAIGDQTET